jgi:hypothetical protein
MTRDLKPRAAQRVGFTATCLLLFLGTGSVRAQEAVFPFDGDAAPGEIYVKAGSSPPTFVAGRDGRAIEFSDGAVVALPLDIDARRHPQVTVSLWIKASAEAATQGWLFGPGDGNNQPFLQIVSGRHVAVMGRYADGTPGTLRSATTLPIDKWVPLAATWDYDKQSIRLQVGQEVKVFENLKMDVAGGDVGPQRLWVPPDAPSGTESKPYVFIGARNFRFGFPLSGYAVDDVHIYTRGLSGAEVSDLTEGGAVDATELIASGGTSTATGPMCSSHADCAAGTYCAFDRTCHPDSHAPLTPLTLEPVPVTAGVTPVPLDSGGSDTGSDGGSGTAGALQGTTLTDAALASIEENRIDVPEKTSDSSTQLPGAPTLSGDTVASLEDNLVDVPTKTTSSGSSSDSDTSAGSGSSSASGNSTEQMPAPTIDAVMDLQSIKILRQFENRGDEYYFVTYQLRGFRGKGDRIFTFEANDQIWPVVAGENWAKENQSFTIPQGAGRMIFEDLQPFEVYGFVAVVMEANANTQDERESAFGFGEFENEVGATEVVSAAFERAIPREPNFLPDYSDTSCANVLEVLDENESGLGAHFGDFTLRNSGLSKAIQDAIEVPLERPNPDVFDGAIWGFYMNLPGGSACLTTQADENFLIPPGAAFTDRTFSTEISGEHQQ